MNKPISQFTTDESKIRDQLHKDLIHESTYTKAVFLILSGKTPLEQERKMFDAMFVATIDHGIDTPSTKTAANVAKTGKQDYEAMAAGYSSLNELHGCAVTPCASLLASDKNPEKIVTEYLGANIVIPGFGHRLYKTTDPRVTELLFVAKENGFHGQHVKKALAIEAELAKTKGEKLPLNIDGILAALTLELGFNETVGNMLFMIPRSAGFAAHILEAKKNL